MLGIDISKAKLDTALRDSMSREVIWSMQVDNSAGGIERLLERTPPEVAWVIEPTGRYSQLAVKVAFAAGRRVLLAPPKKARKFLESIQDRAKTDPADGRGLALFGLATPLAPYPIKSEKVEQLDQLLLARRNLSRMISSLQLQGQELSYARETLNDIEAGLRLKLKALDERIASLAKENPEFELAGRLQKVPGIGAVTSVAMTSRLVSCQFGHPDKFVAYVGLDIRVVQSGKRKGERGLTKQGDAELRRLLYLCALSSIRSKESPYRRQYERELQKGLAKPAAICAVARKMARLCWALWRHGSEYDPERVGRQPKKLEGEEEHGATVGASDKLVV